MNERKIIQITSSESAGTVPTVWALCDDGTVWEFLCDMGESWQRLPAIPQPFAKEDAQQ